MLFLLMSWEFLMKSKSRSFSFVFYIFFVGIVSHRKIKLDLCVSFSLSHLILLKSEASFVNNSANMIFLFCSVWMYGHISCSR